MTSVEFSSPDSVPVLSRGKHRTSRSGGCFMEFASYLAGESWSDHPSCTHPVLASLARMVNDCTSDEARPRLALLIPSVIGLTGTDKRVDAAVALRAASAALPVANLERQHALAVGILNCERYAAALDATFAQRLHPSVQAALDQVPEAQHWAEHFIRSMRSWSHATFTSRTVDTILRVSVQGIAEACVPDPDARLFALLDEAIDDCTALLRPRTAVPSIPSIPLAVPAWNSRP